MPCQRSLVTRCAMRIARNLTPLAILIVVATMTALAGWSQTVSATLLGTVTDPTGGVVPNAKVTVTETQTGTPHATHTNESGNWNIPNLPPGQYQVEVEVTGFKKETRKDITLLVD